jgi:hypothetical protein
LPIFRQMESKDVIPTIKPARAQTISPAQVIEIRSAPAVVIQIAQKLIVRPIIHSVAVVSPARSSTVTPPLRGAWDERGWTKRGTGRHEIYEGHYLVGTRKYRGRIEVRNGHRDISPFIYDPPLEIKKHPHGSCFQLVSDDWFHLHWSRPARNVDDAILYMERILDESINSR